MAKRDVKHEAEKFRRWDNQTAREESPTPRHAVAQRVLSGIESTVKRKRADGSTTVEHKPDATGGNEARLRAHIDKQYEREDKRRDPARRALDMSQRARTHNVKGGSIFGDVIRMKQTPATRVGGKRVTAKDRAEAKMKAATKLDRRTRNAAQAKQGLVKRPVSVTGPSGARFTQMRMVRPDYQDDGFRPQKPRK